MRKVFTFNLVHPQDGGLTELPPSTVTSLHEMQRHVLDAIENLNTTHVALEVAARMNRISKDHDERNTTHPCHQHQVRFYQRNLHAPKVLTLHRKVFYDEVMEKLIITQAEVVQMQGVQRDNPNLLRNEVRALDLRIIEPE